MTPDQLPPGPELDRRVAEILGWTCSDNNSFSGFYATRADGKMVIVSQEHDYSTDPACQSEMLAWLRDKKGLVTISDMDATFGGNYWGADWDQGPHNPRITYLQVRGTTIEHALARLVCAVKAREASK
jgi:hypothetical protein